jgi:hypothetical protein
MPWRTCHFALPLRRPAFPLALVAEALLKYIVLCIVHVWRASRLPVHRAGVGVLHLRRSVASLCGGARDCCGAAVGWRGGQDPTVTNKVFFDVSIDGKPSGAV